MSNPGSVDFNLNERKEIERLIKQGFTYPKIAKILNRSKTGINQEVLRAGGRDQYNAETAHQAALTRKQLKYQGISKKIAYQKLDIIKQGLQEKWSYRKIRDVSRVSYKKLKSLISENGIENLIEENYIPIEDRISAIEMQIEIIVDQLRRLNERNSKNK